MGGDFFMSWVEFKKRIKRRPAHFLEIPSDIMLNLPRIEGKIKRLELESV